MLKQVQALYAAANKNRLARSCGKAAAGGAVASLIAGHTDVKTVGGAAAGAAGVAFLNFIKNPAADKSDGGELLRPADTPNGQAE